MMTFEPSRLPPRMPVTAYKTYAVTVPRATHTRVVTCAEYECDQYRDGWVTVLDLNSPQHVEAANWIVLHSGRRHALERTDTTATFRFPPGEQCFREHRVQNRPGIYVVRDGDHRGNPTGRKAVLSERAWLDDFGEHQEKLATEQERG